MRKIFSFLLIVLVVGLVACSTPEEPLPTAVPTIDLMAEVPPTVTPTPTLVATWTPMPYPHKNAGFAAQSRVGGSGTILLPQTGEGRVYYVQPGDTLAKIANWYGCSLYELASQNRISNINRIEVGSMINVSCGR